MAVVADRARRGRRRGAGRCPRRPRRGRRRGRGCGRRGRTPARRAGPAASPRAGRRGRRRRGRRGGVRGGRADAGSAPSTKVAWWRSVAGLLGQHVAEDLGPAGGRDRGVRTGPAAERGATARGRRRAASRPGTRSRVTPVEQDRALVGRGQILDVDRAGGVRGGPVGQRELVGERLALDVHDGQARVEPAPAATRRARRAAS